MSPGNFPMPVDHSMEGLPVDSRIRQIYPEDSFPNGSIQSNYAPLLYGRVRYWIIGPEDGVKVVLIHGISTPSITWKEIGPYLAERGFRLLIYDLYGKGYSEAPKTAYDATLFVIQLGLLLQYVRWDCAHIVGFSMGGGIAAAFSASLPHLVAGKTAFISSAGLVDQLPEQPQSQRVSLPQYKELRDLQASHLPGYKRSLLSCFECGPIRGLQSSFDKLSNITVGSDRMQLKVLIIHGTDDEIVHHEEADKIKSRIPQAELVKVEGAFHDVVLKDKHWQIVAENLERFLR